MENIWEKFDQAIDVDSLKNDIQEGKKTERFVKKNVPHGTYIVEVDRMYLRESKNGNPMVTIYFRIVEGEYSRQMVFCNQVINNRFGLSKMNTLLKQMDTSQTITFESYEQYGKLIEEIESEINDAVEFELQYVAQASDPNWSDFEITDVYDLE